MTEIDRILYAGYGANRDPAMIEAITGSPPKVIGRVAIVGFELCVQTIDQTPDQMLSGAPSTLTVRETLKSDSNWGSNSGFETYTIRPQGGSNVDSQLFELSVLERDLIAEWEMIDFGWYAKMQVPTVDRSGCRRLAETEGLRGGQAIARVVNGQRYSTYLNDKQKMFAIAAQTRREYFERLGQAPPNSSK